MTGALFGLSEERLVFVSDAPVSGRSRGGRLRLLSNVF